MANTLVQLQRVVAPRHLAGIVAVGPDIEADAGSFFPSARSTMTLVFGPSSAALSTRSTSCSKPQLHAERVELVRAVERDHAKPAVDLVENLLAIRPTLRLPGDDQRIHDDAALRARLDRIEVYFLDALGIGGGEVGQRIETLRERIQEIDLDAVKARAQLLR